MRRTTPTMRRSIMTCKYNYKSVTLKNSTYDLLNELSETLVPGFKLSYSGTVEQLIMREAKCNSSGDKQEKYNGPKEAIKI